MMLIMLMYTAGKGDDDENDNYLFIYFCQKYKNINKITKYL